MATLTTNFSFSKPTVGTDKDIWGGLLNANWDALDALLPTYLLSATAATTYLPRAGGTLTGALTISAVFPTITINQTGGAVDNKAWRIEAETETFKIGTKTDAFSGGATALSIDRTGTVVDDVRLGVGTSSPAADSALTRGRGDLRYAMLSGATFTGPVITPAGSDITSGTVGLRVGNLHGFYAITASELRLGINGTLAYSFSSGTAAALATTALSREKGDARYVQLGTSLIDQSAHTALSGSSIDISGIPSSAKRIDIAFDGLSLSGTDDVLVRLGDSGGVETTGYVSGAHRPDSAATSSTAGMVLYVSAAASVLNGTMTLINVGSNRWISSHSWADGSGTVSSLGGGSKTLSDVLTQVRIATSGANTFDAGSVTVMWQ